MARTVFFSVLAIVALLVVTAIASRGCDPWAVLYGLEPQRIAPKKSKDLPKVPAASDAYDYLLLPSYENSPYAIHVRLPHEYVLHPEDRRDVSVTYSFSTKMYYPDMSGIGHPKNERYRKCNGYCEGYVSTQIKAVIPSNEGNRRHLARLYKDRDSQKPYVVYKKLMARYGFDEHFMFVYPMQKPGGEHEYFVKKSRSGEPELILKCSPNVPSPACGAWVLLKDVPELQIWIHFGMHLLPEWEKVLAAMDKKISGWVIKKYELSEARHHNS